MARRILNRKDLRADFDAAERRKADETEDEVEDEAEDEDEDEDEEEAEAEGEAEDEEGGDEEDEDEEAPKKKKKKAKAPAKAKVKAPAKAKRTRTPKVVRMRVVWGVFNNSNQCVATYEYPKKTDAVEHAARLTADKRSTHFIQPVKEPIEEKKEKEK